VIEVSMKDKSKFRFYDVIFKILNVGIIRLNDLKQF